MPGSGWGGAGQREGSCGLGECSSSGRWELLSAFCYFILCILLNYCCCIVVAAWPFYCRPQPNYNKRYPVFLSWTPPTALPRKCERLWTASTQKGLACIAVAQRHSPMALLAQWNTETGAAGLPCHFKLQTYPVILSRIPLAALPWKCENLRIAPTQKGLAWIADAQPHLPIVILAQANTDWGYVLALPPQTWNIASESFPDASRTQLQRCKYRGIAPT